MGRRGADHSRCRNPCSVAGPATGHRARTESRAHARLTTFVDRDNTRGGLGRQQQQCRSLKRRLTDRRALVPGGASLAVALDSVPSSRVHIGSFLVERDASTTFPRSERAGYGPDSPRRFAGASPDTPGQAARSVPRTPGDAPIQVVDILSRRCRLSCSRGWCTCCRRRTGKCRWWQPLGHRRR